MAIAPIEISADVLRQVDTLLFDLGGVLFAIDPQRSLRELESLRPPGSPPPPAHTLSLPLFSQFETGELDAAGFRAALRRELSLDADDAAIDQAWNALLVDTIPGRVDQLRALGETHRLVMLSNTNPIHVARLRESAAPLFDCFEQLLLSYELGSRKPEPEIFERAASLAGITPSRCLFFDDGPQNCAAAEPLGFRTQFVAASRL